jgi:hypothetical protein
MGRRSSRWWPEPSRRGGRGVLRVHDQYFTNKRKKKEKKRKRGEKVKKKRKREKEKKRKRERGAVHQITRSDGPVILQTSE